MGPGIVSGPLFVSQVCTPPVDCSHAVLWPPAPVTIAFTVPMSGLNSYMKRQITDAATNEMAMGMKIADLAMASYRTRVARTAINRPMMTVPAGYRMSQRTLLSNAECVSAARVCGLLMMKR